MLRLIVFTEVEELSRLTGLSHQELWERGKEYSASEIADVLWSA